MPRRAQPDDYPPPRSTLSMQARRHCGLRVRFAFAFGLALALLPSRPMAAEDSVVVGSKIDTEGALLGNLIAAALERRGVPVRRRLQLGPTSIVRAALLAGEIDLYPEYTGNGAFFFHRESDPVWKDGQAGYDAVAALDRAQNALVWLAPAPADNGWAIAVRRDLAEAQRLRCLGDLARYVGEGGRLRLAASAEFVESPAALPAFQAAYGFRLSDRQLLVLAGGNTAATIRAAAEGTSGVNAAMAYGTDGALAVLGLTALCDDKKAQIVYRPAPVARAAALDRHPEIAPTLEPVFAALTLDHLQALNARIAVEGEEAKAVAEDFLQAQDLRR